MPWQPCCAPWQHWGLGNASAEVPASAPPDGGCRRSQSRHGNGAPPAAAEGVGKGAGKASAEIPAPGLQGGGHCGGPQGFETVWRRQRRRPSGKLACRGARFLFFPFSLPSPCPGVLGWNFAWGGGRPARAGWCSGRGVAPQAPGGVLEARGARAAFGGLPCGGRSKAGHGMGKFCGKFDKRSPCDEVQEPDGGARGSGEEIRARDPRGGAGGGPGRRRPRPRGPPRAGRRCPLWPGGGPRAGLAARVTFLPRQDPRPALRAEAVRGSLCGNSSHRGPWGRGPCPGLRCPELRGVSALISRFQVLERRT